MPTPAARYPPLLAPLGSASPDTRHPAPHTRHHTPDTIKPTPHTPHPTACTLHPTRYTLHPTPRHPSPHRFRARREQLGRFQRLLPASHDQNLALAVLHVPDSLDGGRGVGVDLLDKRGAVNPAATQVANRVATRVANRVQSLHLGRGVVSLVLTVLVIKAQ